MAQINYSDAVYNTAISNYSTGYFQLSGVNNDVVLLSAGNVNSIPVIGIAYNENDWSGVNTSLTGVLSSLAARVVLSVVPTSQGVVQPLSGGNSLTTFSVNVSAVNGLDFALVLANKTSYQATYVGGTFTYNAELSAFNTLVIDKNTKRLNMLGYSG